LQIAHESLGAQIISIDDYFYVSPLLPNEPTSHRAGIPILFPQFAERGPLKKHGIARNREWHLKSENYEDLEKRIHYALEMHPQDDATWPHAAKLDLHFLLTPDEINVVMTIENSGKTEFSWAGGLHPYFAVDDIIQVKLKGLQNCLVDNKYNYSQIRFHEQFKTFSEGACESLFDSQGPIELIMPTHTLILHATGFNQWMVWNPGKEGAKEIYDLPDEQWNRFVCIEPLVVNPPRQLTPGEVFTGTFKIERRSNIR
jgi:glucose-6-phosphate 1-epimerase